MWYNRDKGEYMDYYCTKCGRKLRDNNIAWLELNNVDNKYYLHFDNHPEWNMPEEESQGAFVFGKDCAISVACSYLEQHPKKRKK